MNKCFFVACKAPVTHTVQRLWVIKGQPLPLLHCCDQHKPGAGPRYPENAALAAKVRQRVAGRSFYEVTPLSL